MLRWTLTVVTVLLLAVWVGSMRFAVMWASTPTSSQMFVGSFHGAIGFGREEWSPSAMPGGIEWRTNSASEGLYGFVPTQWFDWDIMKGLSGKPVGSVVVPLWIFIPLAGVPAIVQWEAHRAAMRGPEACPACGYDLAGLPRVEKTQLRKCPECGA